LLVLAAGEDEVLVPELLPPLVLVPVSAVLLPGAE
jgi:hypothetical protein